ncbi:MAG: alanine racemase [Bacillota bacterium]
MNFNRTRPAFLEIDLKALDSNYQLIRKDIPEDTMIASVVKADAYGHGAVEAAKYLLRSGTDYLAVSCPEEALELRNAGIGAKIIVLGEILPEQYNLIIEQNLIQTAASFNTLEGLNRKAASRDIIQPVHIKIDTGMGRIGFLPEEVKKVFSRIKALDNIKTEGVFTHFAAADQKDKTYTRKQWDVFINTLEKIEEMGFEIEVKHAANSAAVIDLPEKTLNMVRPGIMLYGMYPSDEVQKRFELKPVLSFKSRIVQIRELKKGSKISYGGIYKTENRERLAVLPVGYKDGYLRALSNKSEVLIKGKRAPVRGRICMGQIIVSLENIPEAEVGDEAVLLGRQGREEITASELAELAGTINYEITTSLSSRLRKKYIK